MSEEPPVRVTGKVKWFSRPRGYGFIAPEDGGEDIFIMQDVVTAAGLMEIRMGASITCEAARTPKGLVVVRVLPGSARH